ncbi:type II toxin-antitoxin system RelE/ParE family toxin [Turneriella parva]|uniref:Plasmid stabilization system n=1 Tax=Turneriella parva (strain ATCC BAA-1111 / DSM 21527 / NCTC 11395 / H) TaxID=869212 RepID=I4B0K5_TURPD|nr:type II toxin-antitoxin system RelE/ParE family toxin [Turneriella parva]AFM10812.1 plasmid stabilization system [Turneriella parva DSM 21527]
MARKLLVWPEAEADLTAAAIWYSEIRANLAEAFLSDFSAIVQLILDNLQMGVAYGKEVRKLALRKFPYIVYYRNSEQIEIVACLHAGREPGLLAQRVQH